MYDTSSSESDWESDYSDYESDSETESYQDDRSEDERAQRTGSSVAPALEAPPTAEEPVRVLSASEEEEKIRQESM